MMWKEDMKDVKAAFLSILNYECVFTTTLHVAVWRLDKKVTLKIILQPRRGALDSHRDIHYLEEVGKYLLEIRWSVFIVETF